MFDKEKFAKLLIEARGERTNADYAKDSGISRGYISGYVNKNIDNPPSPEILRKLALKAAKDISYEDLMEAAGYLPSSQLIMDMKKASDHPLFLRPSYSEKNDPPRHPSLFPNAIPVSERVKLPIIGNVKAGPGGLAYEEPQGFEWVEKTDINGAEYFWLIVKGDSMSGDAIMPGDLALVRVQPEVEDGEIAIVMVNGEEGALNYSHFRFA